MFFNNLLENSTTSTATFPKTASNTTTQTEPLSQLEPITSSQAIKHKSVTMYNYYLQTNNLRFSSSGRG